MVKAAGRLTYADQKKLRRISSEVVPTTNETSRPILLFTIANGAAHTRAADSIARAIVRLEPRTTVRIVEVSDFMTPLARFTHVTAYLWVVKNLPAVWRRIDAYQKRQSHTSPEWFYRRSCRRIFDLVNEIKPKALVATEVGCGEIAALVKRDLNMDVPLVAVDLDYDFDRAWVQPEVDLYCLAVESLRDQFKSHGVPDSRSTVWGVPIDGRFNALHEKSVDRKSVSDWLSLPLNRPIVILAGGGEGLGGLREVAEKLVRNGVRATVVVLTGHNRKLQRAMERMAAIHSNVRILGWTDRVPELFRAADVLVSKLGTTFDEACACGLPLIALPPLPGAESAKYRMIEQAGLGFAADSPNDAADKVIRLLDDRPSMERIRMNQLDRFRKTASENIAAWLLERTN